MKGEKRCETCANWWWDGYPPSSFVNDAGEKITEGQCRAAPPSHDGFPMVKSDMWCGQYMPDPEKLTKFRAEKKNERQ